MRLLQRIRPLLTLDAAEKVYSVIVVPLTTYSSNIHNILKEPFNEKQHKRTVHQVARSKQREPWKQKIK